ncbi:MFS transporter [Sphingobium sp. AEW013]|uniref:MFS transporter n=2 Tax=unclassified Sphingobium TaxID=2611147 RepID=UPI00119C103B|nr:MFS transporter [Sphingobium sp. AEW013]TWD19036.1 putative MFS family arabinose efflux permease [Sphingobium sp. AEW013]
MMTFGFRRGWGWLLLTALMLSTIGDEITLITLMFRTAGDHAALAIPLLLIAQLVPGLLAAPYIGRLTDRRDAGFILILASLAQAMIVAWLAFSASLPVTIVGASILGLLFAISGTATFALIPVLAQGLGMTLARANAALEFVRSAGMLAGPVVGGILVSWGGTRNALLIDAISFALLAIVIWGSGVRRQTQPEDGEQQATPTLLAEYLPLLRNRRIVIMVAALTLEVFATAIADVAFIFLVTVSLGAGATALGVLTAFWAGGMLLGAALAGEIAERHPARWAFATAALLGASMLAIGVMPLIAVPSLAGVAVAFVVGGAANSVHNVAVRTMLQRESAPDTHGKVAAIYVTATRSATITGFLAGGLFVPAHAFNAYVVGGLLGVIAGLAGWGLFRLAR